MLLNVLVYTLVSKFKNIIILIFCCMKPVAFLSELMVQILCALNFLGVM